MPTQPDDGIVWDAYDRLFHREPLAEAPLTLWPRNPDPERLPEVLERCGALLADRPQADEILLLLPRAPRVRPPGCWGGKTVRLTVRGDAAEGPAWAWALRAARGSALLLTNGAASLTRADRNLLLHDLEAADAVVGTRRGRRRFDVGFGVAGTLLRTIFGVQPPDPFSPHLALRRRAIAGVELAAPPDLLPFELLAKLTFSTALCSWPPLAAAAPPDEPGAGRRLCRNLSALRRLWSAPRIWRSGPLDPPRAELSAPEPIPPRPAPGPRAAAFRAALPRQSRTLAPGGKLPAR